MRLMTLSSTSQNKEYRERPTELLSTHALLENGTNKEHFKTHNKTQTIYRISVQTITSKWIQRRQPQKKTMMVIDNDDYQSGEDRLIHCSLFRHELTSGWLPLVWQERIIQQTYPNATVRIALQQEYSIAAGDK